MQSDLDKFTVFYKTQHSNKRLDYDHSLGTVQMHAEFKAGNKDLSVSLYQAIILLMFNDQDEVSYTEIKDVTQLGL